MNPLPPPLAIPIPLLQHNISQTTSEVDRNHKFSETIKLTEERQPLRGRDEDFDLISGWARNLSVSPRLYPTSFSTNHDSSTFGGGYKGLGEGSPLLGPRSLSVGTGLSPLLGPTTTSGMIGGGYDYSYSGNGGSYRSSLHLSPPSNPTTLGSVNHSFSNLIDRNLSVSPPAMNLHSSSVPLSSKNLMLHSGSVDGKQEMLPPPIPSPKIVKRLSLSTSSSAAQLLPLATTSMIAGDTSKADETNGVEDPRIKAYAKLEFPNFDMYIQKLSVIVGRRPAPVVAVAASSSLLGADGSLLEEEGKEEEVAVAEVKLEDFVMGLEDDIPPIPTEGDEGEIDALELLKEAEAEQSIIIPTPSVVLSITPSSPLDTTFLEASPTHESDQATAASVLELIDLLKSASPSLIDSSHDIKPSMSPLEDLILPSTDLLTSANLEAISISPPVAPVELPAPIVTDIDLGPIRAVSRQHARLYFDYDLGSWAIEVLGRNGVVVEGTWKAKGEKGKLGRRTKIQIAERIFYFVLPTIDEPTTNLDDPYGLGPLLDSSDDEGDGVEGDDDSSSLSEVTDSDLELSPSIQVTAEFDDVFSSDLSGGSVSPLPLLNMILPELPKLTLLPPTMPIVKLEIGSGILPTVLNELGRGRRYSSNQRTYYDDGDGPERFASTSAYRPTFVFNGSSGKNLKTIEAVRAGGKGKSALAKVKKAVSKKSKSQSYGEGNYGEKPKKVSKFGGKGKGKGGPKMEGRNGKTPYYLKKAKRFAEAMFYSDEEDPVPEFYDDEDDDIVEEDYPEEEMYEYAMAVKREVGPDGRLAEIVPKVRTTVAAKKAPRKPASPKKAPLPLAAPLPLTDTNPYLLSPLIPLPPLPPLPSLGTPTSVLPNLPLPALPAFPISQPATNLSFPKSSPRHSSKSPHATTSYSSVSPAILASPDRSISMDPYALPPAGQENAEEDSSQSILPTEMELGGSVPPERGSSNKRGRGRPPKNGICAQRSRKSKPRPEVLHRPVDDSTSTKGKTIARPSVVSPYTLPHFPGENVANSTLNVTTFTPTIYAAGETPPSAAPPEDRMAKPPFTYASLIAQAIMSTEAKRLTLNGIYDWITFAWPYFSENQNGWQNSIRHNLTISRGFIKVQRTAAEPGKGAFWIIDPAQARNFDGFNFRKKTIKLEPPADGSHSTGTKPSLQRTQQRPGQQRPGGPRPQAKGGPSLLKPLPIIICEIPDSYVRPPPPPSSQPPDELTLALLKDPPIVLHGGNLILNPTIFATLPAAELKRLETRPAKEALEVLQAFVVGHFKAKMKVNQLAKMRTGGGSGTPNAVGGNVTGGIPIDPKLGRVGINGNGVAARPIQVARPIQAPIIRQSTVIPKSRPVIKKVKRKAEDDDDGSDNDFNPKSKK